MALILRSGFLFLLLFFASSANASWQTNTRQESSCSVTAEAAEADATAQADAHADGRPYQIVSYDTWSSSSCYSSARYKSIISYDYWYFYDSPPLEPRHSSKLVYNYVYTDEQCQASYSGNLYSKEAGDSNGGACAVTATTSETCWEDTDGESYCMSEYSATSTGQVNDINGTSEGELTPGDMSEYLTAVESCTAYNCVTLDGQVYEVDYSKINADSNVTTFNNADASTIEYYAGGGNKLTHVDGSYEVTDSTGNVTYYNSDGTVNDSGGSDDSDSGSDGGTTGGDGSTGGTDGSGTGSDTGGTDGSDTSDGSTDGTEEEGAAAPDAWEVANSAVKAFDEGGEGEALIADARSRLDTAIADIRGEMSGMFSDVNASGTCQENTVAAFGTTMNLSICDKVDQWGGVVRSAVLLVGALLAFGIIMRGND